MKLSGYYSLMLSVGLAGKPKSDNNPEKRIQTLGENLVSWTSQHLCVEDRCLKAVTKETGNWEQRITKSVERMIVMYQKCGGVPEREDGQSRKKRDADSDGNSEPADETTENDENSDLNTSDTELTGTTTNSTAALMSARYNREDPLKGVGQLTTAVRKWATDYLSNCRSKRKTANNGIPAISLRMHKWKVVLENGYHKVRKQPDAVKPTPSNWSKWFERKVQKSG